MDSTQTWNCHWLYRWMSLWTLWMTGFVAIWYDADLDLSPISSVVHEYGHDAEFETWKMFAYRFKFEVWFCFQTHMIWLNVGSQIFNIRVGFPPFKLLSSQHITACVRSIYQCSTNAVVLLLRTQLTLAKWRTRSCKVLEVLEDPMWFREANGVADCRPPWLIKGS